MDNQAPKQLFDSVSSKSNEPPFRDFQPSNIFGGRKSSFDYVTISKESDQLVQKDFRNSFDALISNINNTKQNVPFKNIIQLYNNDQDKAKIQLSGFKLLNMQEVNSESEEVINVPQNFPLRVQPIKYENPMKRSADTYDTYFPEDLARLLKNRQIPLNYVRSLLKIRNQTQVKSTRRLKVQRYLQKRRKKTWNRKICYNCRQKVAEERLRIKGKFIKKRRAMEILGITTPIEMVSLKERLQVMLKDKTHEEIDHILRMDEEKD